MNKIVDEPSASVFSVPMFVWYLLICGFMAFTQDSVFLWAVGTFLFAVAGFCLIEFHRAIPGSTEK